MEEILIGVTDWTVTVFIPDPASTDGSGKTGLAHTDMTVSYIRIESDNDVVVTDVTSSLNALTNLTDAHNDWGWKEVSSTLCPGEYRLDCADALFASGARYVDLYVMITSSAAAASPKKFRLVAYNPDDAVRLGLTALPNAAADAAGGLPISDAGGLDLDAQRTDVAAILVDTAEIGAAGAGLTNINLPNQTMDIVGNITGNLSGSVGSVTGAVGSVTGAVGSVTGAVGSVTGNVGGNVTGSVGSVATGGISAASFAAGAIDAAAIAANAIGASELAADAVTEIAAGISIPTAAQIRAEMDSNSTQLAAIVADTNELQTDWVNGGRLDLIVDAILVDTAEIGTAGAGLTNINLPDQTMNITGDITGNLSGSVGSVTTKTGYSLASTGLDLVLVDGKTLPAALQIIAAACAGEVSGAGTGTEVFVGLDGSTTRITYTVDSSGNRSTVVYA